MAEIPIFASVECDELIFTNGTVGKIFDLRKNGGNGNVKSWYFVPFSSHFCPIFLNHIPPQPSTTHILCTMPAITPPVFPHFPPFPPFFQTPNS